MASGLFCLPQRYVFAIVCFLVTLVAYMMRISLDITLPSMVNHTETTPLQYDPFSCPEQVISNETNNAVIKLIKPGIFDWDSNTQTKLSGAFRSGYVITQVLGGMLADKHGGKKIMGITLATLSVSTFIIPFSSKLMGSNALYVLRFISGLVSGTMIPTLLSMMSKWAPRDEQAFIGSIIFPGNLIGFVAATSLGNFMVTMITWEAVFYSFGLLGMICCLIWKVLAYNTPNDHPTISESEKRYLNQSVTSLKRTTRNKLDPLPFKALLRTGALWGIVMGYVGRECAFSVFSVQVPQLLRDVLRFDISVSPFFVYMPYVFMWLAALLCGFICDILIKRGLSSVGNARKIFTSLGTSGAVTCIILVMYSGCSPVLAVFCMFTGMTVLGAFYSGCMIGALDIAPNYAGSVIGIVDNIAINSAELLRGINGLIVTDALLRQWRLLLWIVVVLLLLCIVVYNYYVQTEQMWWDDVRNNGYPENWNHDLLTCEGIIDKDGKSILYKEDNKDERLATPDGNS